MQLSRESNNAKYQITSYTANSITINEQRFNNSILLMPQYLADWPVTDLTVLTSADLLQLAQLKPELILLGTGENLIFPAAKITQALFPYKIGLEIMTTAAACRTYTALTTEGRLVLAALIVNSS